ncbi:hypothetical protein QQX98_002548 [Neonectria punicea]|uniref:NACHT domain-containing protein n=1 Tax=Neonectria punicea TaxID=979145 RepID=A0ABR1HHW8_9HYPO
MSSPSLQKIVKVEPTAAVAWGGITTFMKIIASPVSEPGINRGGINYVLDSVEWYWELTRLLLDPDKIDESSTALQGLLRCHIVNLYKALLLYQMQSVCLYNKHWAAVILKYLVKLDDWQDRIDSVKKAKASLDDYFLELEKEQTRVLHDIQDQKCLHDLYVDDPEGQKKAIENAQGGLLEDSYCWIFDNDDFQRFRNLSEYRLLWIKGDPGKGKIMLICGIIDELVSKSFHPLLYFFCRVIQDGSRDASLVLCGIMWLLCDKHSNLIQYVRGKYHRAGNATFHSQSTLPILEGILTNMLRDPCLQDAVFLIDALDECADDTREDLIHFIVKWSTDFPAKWIVSSRGWLSIEKIIRKGEDIMVSLELNKNSTSQAVKTFIQFKVNELAKHNRYDQKTKDIVSETLLRKSDDTFLWAALVIKDLRAVSPGRAIKKLSSIPRGLNELYERMLHQTFASDEPEICRQVLATACIAYRPVTLGELRTLVTGVADCNNVLLEETIGECGSFLTVRDGIVYFVHQSARDFLINNAKDEIFPLGTQHQHRLLFHHSLDAMKILKRDMYDLQSPGVLIEEISCPEPDPLSCLRYACVYWVDHFEEIWDNRQPSDDEAVAKFVRERFLYWLEALGLKGKMPEGTKAVRKLSKFMNDVESTAVSGLKYLIMDAEKFVAFPRTVDWGCAASNLRLSACVQPQW